MRPVPLSDREVEEARRRLAGWLAWWMRSHPDEAPSNVALGKLLGVSGVAVGYWFEGKQDRLPGFRAMLAIRKVVGVPVDVLLYVDPPK